MEILGLVDVPWWGIVIALLIAYLSYATRNFNYFKKHNIPAVRPLPILGTLHTNFTKSMAVTALELLEMSKEKGCVGVFYGDSPSLTVFDEDMLSDIMVKEFSAFTNRMEVQDGSLMDYMLINLPDRRWKHARSEMTPTFTTGKLKKMNEEVNRCAKNLAESVLKAAKLKENVEIKEYTGGYTMDVIASTAFGIRVNSQEDRNNKFVTMAKEAFSFDIRNPVTILRIALPRLNQLFINLGMPLYLIPKTCQDFFYDITKQTMDLRKANADQSRSDFVQLMLNAEKGQSIKDHDDEKQHGLSDDEILANAMLFFVAGYDTTSTSLSFFLYNMALYPECQAKLIQEINHVIKDKDFVDYSLLQEMPYLEQCVNENLRLYPPAIQVNRIASRDLTIKGINIFKGMIVNIPIFGIQHDPAKWPEPNKFDPERFSAENKKDRNPYHFLPFGNGPRNCIGMRLALQELKIAIIHVLKNVHVSKCEKTQIPVEFANSSELLKAKDGIWLKVEQRNDSN